MSHRQAKRLRAALKVRGIDVRRTSYVVDRSKTREKKFQIGKDPTGLPIYATLITHTVMLDPECGRAQYQQLKRSAA